MWFDNIRCEHCSLELTYDHRRDDMCDVEGRELCDNRSTVESCNWSAPTGAWCASCALNVQQAAASSRVPFEAAKRRTIRQLFGFGIDPSTRSPSLRFDLQQGTEDQPVTIGHADGLITLDTAESDPAKRERRRTSLGEPYRTPLGHVRHELGHWWWQSAMSEGTAVDDFRRVFGDERVGYADALRQHYERGDDGTWATSYVSHYASSHPWEDFAESFAHALHMTDTLETAAANHVVHVDFDAHDFDDVYAAWIETTLVLNELNRSMGMADPYPFAVPAPAVAKIGFVFRSLRGAA